MELDRQRRLFITVGGCDTSLLPDQRGRGQNDIKEVWFNSMDTLTIENLLFVPLLRQRSPYTRPLWHTRFANCPCCAVDAIFSTQTLKSHKSISKHCTIIITIFMIMSCTVLMYNGLRNGVFYGDVIFLAGDPAT